MGHFVNNSRKCMETSGFLPPQFGSGQWFVLHAARLAALFSYFFDYTCHIQAEIQVMLAA